MATLVLCEFPNTLGLYALGLCDETQEDILLVFPPDVEGFICSPVSPRYGILFNVTLENLQERLPEAVLELGKAHMELLRTQ